ncbi:MAG: RNA-binding protein [Caldicoprobacterales bacterium]|jgi:RNA-binding protein YlmH
MFFNYIDGLAQKAQKTGIAHSKFLTAAELEQVRQRYNSRRDVELITDGGFVNAERRIAVFINPEFGTYDRESVISALELTYRRQDSLTHRTILGAVLALGIEREVLGDILIEPGRAFLICLSQISNYIVLNLQKAGKVGLTVSETALDGLPSLPEKYERVTGTVASLRLDAVLAFAFRISRGQAQAKITSGLVQVSHQVCLQPAKTVSIDNIISLRGFGRIRVLEIGDQTRKNRYRIVIGRYV